VRVLIRCDGGGDQGVGHVIRSLALAEEAMDRGHDVLVAGHFEGAFVERQLNASAARVLPLPPHRRVDGVDSPLPLLASHPADVLHLDHYEVGEELAAGLRDGLPGGTLLSNMEDGEFGRRPAHVVIDPTWGSEEAPRTPDGSRWLLRGAGYAAMRHQVTRLRGHTPDHPEAAASVLVLMGGTDPVGLAPLVVRALGGTGLSLAVTVIATGSNASAARDAAAGAPHLRVSVIPPVDDVATLMSEHHLVVSAAGTSVWEMCCIGVPMALVCAVPNQQDGYGRVVAAGAAVGLGGPEALSDTAGTAGRLASVLLDGALRRRLTGVASGIVDGLGAWRVVQTWEQAVAAGLPPAAPPAAWVARVATMDDARTLWTWRNDPVTRASSRTSDEVPWESHLTWLEAALARTDRVILLVRDGSGDDVGTVRWDEQIPGQWEVSITVAVERRGQSLARPLLACGEEHLRRTRNVTAYLAVVHQDNEPSRRLFTGSDYLPDLPADAGGFMRFRKPAPVA